MSTTVRVPIAKAAWREEVRVRGHVRSMRVRPWAGGVATLECTLVDDTGGITLIFLGRRRVAGIHLGAELEAEGMVSESRERLVLLNPVYTLFID